MQASFIADYIGPSFNYMQLIDLENETVTEPILVNGYGPITGYIELDTPSSAPNFVWNNSNVLDFQFTLTLPNGQSAILDINPSSACFNDSQGNFDNCNFVSGGISSVLGIGDIKVNPLWITQGVLIATGSLAPNAPSQCSDSFNWREAGTFIIIAGCATHQEGTWTIRNASMISSPSHVLLLFLTFVAISILRTVKFHRFFRRHLIVDQ